MTTSNFRSYCQAFKDTAIFSQPDDRLTLAERAFDIPDLLADINGGKAAVPLSYQWDFIGPLSLCLTDIKAKLATGKFLEVEGRNYTKERVAAEAVDITAVLVGCITDWWNPELRTPLRHLQGATCSLYRHVAAKFAAHHVNLAGTVPLVTFSATSGIGPHAKSIARVDQFLNTPARARLPGIVALPKGYKDHPLSWGILIHEVVGHIMLNACTPGQKDDAIPGAFNDKLDVALPGIKAPWNGIWKMWMEEVVADVAATLVMGPAFAVNLSAWLSMSAAFAPGGPFGATGQLRNAIWTHAGEVVSHHPPDLVRLYLTRGVIKVLNSSGFLDGPLKILSDIAAETENRVGTIDFVEWTTADPTASFPRAMLCDQAEKIAEYVATTPLTLLNNLSLSDILTWGATDEQVVTGLVNHNYNAGPPSPTPHVLARTTLDLYANAAGYGGITQSLQSTLDQFYANDPDFQGVARTNI